MPILKAMSLCPFQTLMYTASFTEARITLRIWGTSSKRSTLTGVGIRMSTKTISTGTITRMVTDTMTKMEQNKASLTFFSYSCF